MKLMVAKALRGVLFSLGLTGGKVNNLIIISLVNAGVVNRREKSEVSGKIKNFRIQPDFSLVYNVVTCFKQPQ